MEKKIAELRERVAKIMDIGGAMALMGWDQEVNMPPGATATRADQMATIGGMLHEMQISPEMGALLEELHSQVDQLDYDSDDAALIRVGWRDYQKAVKVPVPLVMELYSTMPVAREAWRKARSGNAFSQFQPHLEKLIDIELRMAEALGHSGNPYDALLDFFEPGMTYVYIDTVFSGVKPQLVALIKAISEADQVDDSCLHGHFAKEQQLALGRLVAEKLGYSFEHGRLDLSTHPFTSGNSYRDVRITTRVDETFLPSSLMSVIHEAGHAIHSQQGSPTLYRTGLDNYSLSIAESQSRFYENVVGRSLPFWKYFFPQVQALFPSLKGVALPDFYRAINKVQPSLIRVDADEVTYGMHIMLRFELENAMLNGKVAIKDLPEEWKARMEQYLGIVPPNDAQGVLQDIHWSMSPMGYFPTYLLGSMFAAQLWAALLKERPDTPAEVERGEIAPITAWLGETIHAHGGKFTLDEIAERATGGPMESAPYIDYLTAKYRDIYGLA